MIRIEPIPAFKDNYIWMLHDGTHAAVVDPGIAGPVVEALDKRGLELTAILLTHLHYDHNRGVPGLLERWQVPVFGPLLNDHDRATHPPFPEPGTVPLDCVSHVVGDGDIVTLDAPGLELSVLAVPGHTRGHIVFLERRRGWLFSGDTLFGAGCGKVFGGSMQDMIDSLDRLAGLPDETEVYCAHEYTLANLQFALAVEPGNAAVKERIEKETLKRGFGFPTLPSTIHLERATNPFLRVGEPKVLKMLRDERGVGASTRVAAFEALRSWKDGFQP